MWRNLKQRLKGMTMIIIKCNLSEEDAQAVCDELSDNLDAEVFLGLEDINGWKIPTVEDWI